MYLQLVLFVFLLCMFVLSLDQAQNDAVSQNNLINPQQLHPGVRTVQVMGRGIIREHKQNLLNCIPSEDYINPRDVNVKPGCSSSVSQSSENLLNKNYIKLIETDVPMDDGHEKSPEVTNYTIDYHNLNKEDNDGIKIKHLKDDNFSLDLLKNIYEFKEMQLPNRNLRVMPLFESNSETIHGVSDVAKNSDDCNYEIVQILIPNENGAENSTIRINDTFSASSASSFLIPKHINNDCVEENIDTKLIKYVNNAEINDNSDNDSKEDEKNDIEDKKICKEDETNDTEVKKDDGKEGEEKDIDDKKEGKEDEKTDENEICIKEINEEIYRNDPKKSSKKDLNEEQNENKDSSNAEMNLINNIRDIKKNYVIQKFNNYAEGKHENKEEDDKIKKNLTTFENTSSDFQTFMLQLPEGTLKNSTYSSYYMSADKKPSLNNYEKINYRLYILPVIVPENYLSNLLLVNATTDNGSLTDEREFINGEFIDKGYRNSTGYRNSSVIDVHNRTKATNENVNYLGSVTCSPENDTTRTISAINSTSSGTSTTSVSVDSTIVPQLVNADKNRKKKKKTKIYFEKKMYSVDKPTTVMTSSSSDNEKYDGSTTMISLNEENSSSDKFDENASVLLMNPDYSTTEKFVKTSPDILTDSDDTKTEKLYKSKPADYTIEDYFKTEKQIETTLSSDLSASDNVEQPSTGRYRKKDHIKNKTIITSTTASSTLNEMELMLNIENTSSIPEGFVTPLELNDDNLVTNNRSILPFSKKSSVTEETLDENFVNMLGEVLKLFAQNQTHLNRKKINNNFKNNSDQSLNSLKPMKDKMTNNLLCNFKMNPSAIVSEVEEQNDDELDDDSFNENKRNFVNKCEDSVLLTSDDEKPHYAPSIVNENDRPIVDSKVNDKNIQLNPDFKADYHKSHDVDEAVRKNSLNFSRRENNGCESNSSYVENRRTDTTVDNITNDTVEYINQPISNFVNLFTSNKRSCNEIAKDSSSRKIFIDIPEKNNAVNSNFKSTGYNEPKKTYRIFNDSNDKPVLQSNQMKFQWPIENMITRNLPLTSFQKPSLGKICVRGPDNLKPAKISVIYPAVIRAILDEVRPRNIHFLLKSNNETSISNPENSNCNITNKTKPSSLLQRHENILLQLRTMNETLMKLHEDIKNGALHISNTSGGKKFD